MIGRILGSVALAAALAVPAGHALAAPNNAPTSSTFSAICTFANGTTMPVTVVTNSGQSGAHGQGQPNAYGTAHIVGGGLFLTQSATYTLTVTNSSTTPPQTQTLTRTVTKGNAQYTGLGAPATCTFSNSISQGPFTYTFSGTVTAVENTHARG